MIKVVKAKDKNEMGLLTALEIIDCVNKKPDATLGLATGGTAELIYPHIIEKYKKGEVSFKGVRTVNLDEYKDLDVNNDQSYRYFMNTQLFNHIDIDKARTFVPNGIGDTTKNLEEFNKMLDEYPRDLQLLGVGTNGHIAFNEPDEKLNAKASIVALKEETIKINARFFKNESEVPRYAYSMGMAGIFNAKKIVLAASGENKSNAIIELLSNDKITTKCPITFLKLHTNVVVIIDNEISSKL